MVSLRALYWRHFSEPWGSGPRGTLWDEWLAEPGLWPASLLEEQPGQMRDRWRKGLAGRIITPEGYVNSHQHPSIAHPLGWPMPFWNQGGPEVTPGAFGWHFSFQNTVGLPWRPAELNSPDAWTTQGAKSLGVDEEAWNLELTARGATITTPAAATTPSGFMEAFQSPFLQLRWKAQGLADARPYIEWTSPQQPQFSAQRRVYLENVEGTAPTYGNFGDTPIRFSVVPMSQHPQWTGRIERLRIGFGNAQTGGRVGVQAFFSTYDTRHNINSQSFISGATTYFYYTRDLPFLREQINRMRTALRHMMTEHHTLEKNVVLTTWVGHDGIAAQERLPNGKIVARRAGHGTGNNYWDLMPFGHLDCYATLRYYDTLLKMARLEREIGANPSWNVPQGVLAFDPAFLERHAAQVKAEGNRLFWNAATGRFVPGIDAEGKIHDYGYTFLNLEAIFYDFATPDHARQIMSWIAGQRLVAGDTSQGADIYFWRFAPRASTKRNLNYYHWRWNAALFPFGDQVQDGGAVLGFSHHDLMARLKVFGPDNAWARLQEISRWFDEVQAAGGYRKYYNGSRPGKLQGGGGPPGGLGLDGEFRESALAPQVMLKGFLGFEPNGEGFAVRPHLPREWPHLTINRIHWRNLILRIRAARDAIEITKEGESGYLTSEDETVTITLPAGNWKATQKMSDGTSRPLTVSARRGDGFSLVWADVVGVRFERVR